MTANAIFSSVNISVCAYQAPYSRRKGISVAPQFQKPLLHGLRASNSTCLGYRSGETDGKLRRKYSEAFPSQASGNVIEEELIADAISTTAAIPSNTAEPKTGTIWGAIALITGTSVGAGILALPAETSPAGFGPSAVMLLSCWAFLTLQALLLAKVNVFLVEKNPGNSSHSEVLSIQSMAEQTLGPAGGFVAGATYLGLSYTLLVAYVSKSAEVLSIMTDFPLQWTGAMFTLGLGGLLYRGGTKCADLLNQGLTSALLVAFTAIVIGGSFSSHFELLEKSDWSSAPQVLPVVFLSLVYHDLVPVLCSYFGNDLKKVNISLVVGSLLPLCMFLCWDAVSLSSPTDFGVADPLSQMMRSGSQWQSIVVEVFALLATATSFIGTTLSLSEFSVERIGEMFSSAVSHEKSSPAPEPAAVAQQGPGGALGLARRWLLGGFISALKEDSSESGIAKEKLRFASFLTILLPPLVIGGSNPDAFFAASEAAGGYGMTLLYGVLPPLMAFSLFQSQKDFLADREESPKSSFGIPGGDWSLAGMALCASAVIASQAVLDFNPPKGKPEVILAATESSLIEEGIVAGSHGLEAPSLHVIG